MLFRSNRVRADRLIEERNQRENRCEDGEHSKGDPRALDRRAVGNKAKIFSLVDRGQARFAVWLDNIFFTVIVNVFFITHCHPPKNDSTYGAAHAKGRRIIKMQF